MNKILILAVLIYCTACNKEPVANFSISSTSAIPNQMIVLTNESKDADSFEWTLPDGSKSTSNNVYYTFTTKDTPGPNEFKLVAYSKNKKKISQVTKSILYRMAFGKCGIWVSNPDYIGTQVTIGDFSSMTSTPLGTITSTLSAAPSSCNALGVLSSEGLLLPTGTYAINAINTNVFKVWADSIQITENGCAIKKLE